MGDPALSKLSSELEDAGLLGGAAASILGFVAFGTSEPGFLVTSVTGAVWTKRIENASTHSADIGIGTLTLNGGALTATAGFAFDDDGLTDFSLLVEFTGASAATPLSLALPKSVAFLKPAVKDGEKVVGYDIKATEEAVTFDLPLAGALEISIRRTAGGVQSALVLHGAAAGAGLAAQGIFQVDLADKVLVLPRFLKLGISIKTLFVDLSSSAATPVSGLFPEVYDPRWKGVGAKSIGLHVPLDDKGGEWVNAVLDGFLLGFDGRVSFKGTIAYKVNDPGPTVREVSGELDVRNNEIVKGAFAAVVDLQKATEAVSDSAIGTSSPGLTAAQQNIVSTVERDVADAKESPEFSFGGNLKCRMQLIRVPVGQDEIFGLDLTVEAIELPNKPAGLIVQGLPARIIFWLALGGGGLGLFYKGLAEKSGLKAFSGMGLIYLAICDLGDFLADNAPRLLPKLDRLEFRRLTFRRVDFPAEGVAPQKSLYQIELDVVVTMIVGGTLNKVIGAMVGRGLAAAQSFGKLFDKTTDEVELKGVLELGFDNISIAFETTPDGTALVTEIDERVRRVAGVKDLQVKARKLPSIQLIDAPPQAPSEGFKALKPIVGVEFISQDQGGDSRYGIAIELRGLEYPSWKLESPVVAGLVLYLYPEVAIEFDASLLVEPRFRFVVPHWLLVDGAFEINKPIPSFNGTQSRIAVDVGLVNSEVAKGTKLEKAQLGALNDLSKYKYRGGGEFAWGEAESDDPTRTYDFWFFEIHYDAATPFIVIGPVGIYGLAGLVGRNIAPGLPGDSRDASAIANWIEGDAQSFENILEWPSPPSTSGWHPARDFEDDEDLVIVGLKVRAGPVGKRTVDVDGLLMLGFNEFWLAAAGRVTIKAIKFGAVAIVVYDNPSNSFTIRIRFEFRIDSSGGAEILSLAGPIEISSGPGGFRIVFGHYLPDRGGPIVASLFKDLFRAQLYGIYDSGAQGEFGFAMPGMDARPDLAPGAYSHGVLFQYGPKKIGPSGVNIRIHAAAGYNIGLSGDPFVLVGELFLSGGLQVKVWFVNVGFTLAAFLSGRLTDNRFDFRGRIVLEIGMPWPISDIEIPLPLSFGMGSGDDIPQPALTSVATVMSHAVPRATEIAAAEVPIVPIDAVIGLRFNKPIVGLTKGPNTKTTLVDITPVSPNADGATGYKDLVETKFLNETYTIEYLHFLTDVRITRRPVAGGASVTVQTMKAAWEAPPVFDTGSGGASDTGHRAIYFNTLLQPELSAHPEQLGTFIKGQITNGTLPPCQRPARVCMMAESAPVISEAPGTGLRRADRETGYGPITVRETRLPPDPLPIVVSNLARLAWSGGALRLPSDVAIIVPTASWISAELELQTVVSPLVGTTVIALDVVLPDPLSPVRLVMRIDVAQTPCGLALKTELIPATEARIKVNATVRTCATQGVIVLAVEITALQEKVHLYRFQLHGPSILPPGFGPGSTTDPIDLDSWLKITSQIRDGPALFLNELCFETIEASPDAWDTEVQNFGTGPPSDDSIDQFSDTLLLEPDNMYEIHYRVLSSGLTATDGDGGDQIDAQRQFEADSAMSGELRTVRFRTAPEPTREIAPYVGFVYPGAGLAPVYADQTVPMVTFRSNSLIKRIYQAHRRADVLKPVIRDEAGDKLAVLATGSLSISSSAAGDVVEGLIAPCLSEAQGFTRIDIDFFERRLAPDTRYALSVEDTSLADTGDLPPYRVSFRTSRHATFSAHVAAANALLANPVQVPLVGADTSQILASVFADAARGALAGYDALVEAIYRRALAHETGRLADEFGAAGDVAAQMVAIDSAGTVTAFGFALELAEPLFGKDGVAFGGVALPLPTALQNKGIALVQTDEFALLTVRDRSGSRMLAFRSADATTFTAILSPARLDVAFDGTEAIRAAVTGYVTRNFAALSAALQMGKVETVMTNLEGQPEMAGGLVQQSGTLVLPPVSGA